MDDDCVATGARISDFFFVNINLLDEGSENFRCELFNVDILFSLRYELFDVFILQIGTNLRLFFLVT